ncbi:hypothetical protein BX600DRAFT_431973 [Xylariales sp. PMI_506]|nr:hypothetical protein BX600DRAFT_431973 [Xylariales sp. PMI_506]
MPSSSLRPEAPEWYPALHGRETIITRLSENPLMASTSNEPGTLVSTPPDWPIHDSTRTLTVSWLHPNRYGSPDIFSTPTIMVAQSPQHHPFTMYTYPYTSGDNHAWAQAPAAVTPVGMGSGDLGAHRAPTFRGRRVFIGNLAYRATHADIYRMLRYHSIRKGAKRVFLKAPCWDTGRHRVANNLGYAVVTYTTAKMAAEAFATIDGIRYMNRPLACHLAWRRGLACSRPAGFSRRFNSLAAMEIAAPGGTFTDSDDSSIKIFTRSSSST